MKRHIPRRYLLAFARECLKLEQLLSERDDLAELGKFLNLIRSMEKSGGISALEALLRPEHTGSVGLSTAWDSAVCSAAKEAAALPLKDGLRPLTAPSTQASHTKETP
jgi:hypothetical protein